MARYMIELEHDERVAACEVAARTLRATGSHFLTHADWGCLDGVHTAWIVVDAANREQARRIVPPLLRPRARVIALNAFSLDRLDELLVQHGGLAEAAVGEAA